MSNVKSKLSKLSAVCLLSTVLLQGCGSSNDNTSSANGSSDAAKTNNSAASADSANSTNNATADSSGNASSNASDNASEPAKLDHVDLTYYFVNSPQADIASVEAALNKLVEPKINATIHLKLVDWGAYDEKMKLVNASGEPYDLAFTATWTNNFYQNVANGAFAPIDDLIDKYAPDTKAGVPDMFWKTVKVKGKTYGVPNFQQATAGYGYLIQKTIADKYKLDWKSVKSLNDLTPFLETIKANEKSLIPFGYNQVQDPFLLATPMFGYEALGDTKTPGWLSLQDGSKVINQYETKAFSDYIHMMRDWYTKGYLRKDAATLKDNTADAKAGKDAIAMGQIDIDTPTFEAAGLKPGGRMSNFNKDVQSYDLQFVKPLLTTDKAAATITAISANSPNKERAMMFINLLNTDPEIYNTITWGVEGKHYKKVADNRIETIKDGGYQTLSPWEFGNMTQTLYFEGDPQGAEVNGVGTKLWADLNRNATPSSALGFVFDFTPVKTEKANCDAVIDELYYAIASGSVDPDKYLPQFIDRMKKAGADKIIAEKQKQLDEWRAANQ
ncbi:putative aldouronate transport system substrate-binding protein [Paenibacillus taihuensis]|uniref:Putative aldouronate transport system substrate-binding protein n=1 Tax=Paenibacillus taihuensis TaxID=1156355 RepID=A0A3D9S434_9BACL|nr:ABC transporter substrate-binding protein [Paenibacillus taihuensis]REE87422.1 putative aldouronate transport system substrate-binding protein [Paenibacillus taihuensis]